MYSDIESTIKEFEKIFSPEKMYVFGVKTNSLDDKITDFDVCVIADFKEEEKRNLLKKAYLQTDSEIPFDVFLYSPEEFYSLSKDSASFVSRILRIGKLYYEKK